MSTRSTILWADDAKPVSHIWEETGRGNADAAEGDIVVDLSNAHIYGAEVDKEGVSFVVRKGSKLHAALLKLRG